MSFTPVTVSIQFVNGNGNVPTGTVSFTPTAAMSNGGAIAPIETATVALSAGAGTVVLNANDDSATSPAGSGYTVVESIVGAPQRTYQIVLSKSQTAVNLGDLAPAVTAPLYSYVLTSAVGAPNGVAPLGADGKVPSANLPAGQGGGAVASVAGRTGAVVLSTGDITGLGSAATHAATDFDSAGAATAAQAFAIQRGNHTGTESADVLTDGATNKAYTATERAKLAGIATGATAVTVAAAGTAGAALSATDPSTSNARTPTAHAASHGQGGSDPITVAAAQVTGLGTAATQPSSSFDAAGAAAAAQAASVQLGLRGRDVAVTQASIALQPLHAAIAGRNFAPAPIIWLGDSHTEGMGSTAWVNRMIARFGLAIRNRYPTAGVAGPASGVNWIDPYVDAATLTALQPFTITGGTSKNTGFGIGLKGAQMNGSIGPMTSNSASGLWTGLTSFQFAYRQTSVSNQNVGVTINGGATTNVSITNAAGGAEKLSQSFPLTGGTDSVVLSYATGTAVSVITGCKVHNGDESKGITVYPAGHYGYTTANWVAGMANWSQWIGLIQPCAVFIDLMANDWFTGVDPATAQANLASIVSSITTAATGAGIRVSIVIIGDTQRSDTANAYTWQQYISAGLAVAQSYANGYFVDLTLRMPNVSGDTLGLYYDAVHASNKGHEYKAQAILDAIAIR